MLTFPDPPSGLARLETWSKKLHRGATGYVFAPSAGLPPDGLVDGRWVPALVRRVVTAARAEVTIAGRVIANVAPEAFAIAAIGEPEPEPEPEPWLPGVEHLKGRRKKR